MIAMVVPAPPVNGRLYAVRIWLNPTSLASRGIGINEVSDAVSSGNVNTPTGVLYGPYQAVTIKATGQLNVAEEFKPLVVTYRNGYPVRLGELGQVVDSVENNKTLAWYVTSSSQLRGVILAIQKQPGTKTVSQRCRLQTCPSIRLQKNQQLRLHKPHALHPVERSHKNWHVELDPSRQFNAGYF